MLDIRNGVVYDTSLCLSHGNRSMGLSPVEGQEKEFEELTGECQCLISEVLVHRLASVRRLKVTSRYHERPRSPRGIIVMNQGGESRLFASFPPLYVGERIPTSLWEQGKPCTPAMV